MGFIEFFAETAGATMRGYPKLQEIKEMYVRVQVDENEVSAVEFLRTYDLRVYDFNNKQDDIKLMKKMDFPGVYIIHNRRTEEYFYGISEKVFHKVFRIFNGNEGNYIFSSRERIDSYSLRLININRTIFDNIDKLKNAIESVYDGTLDSIKHIFCIPEVKNHFSLKEEKKFLRHIYTLENGIERFYGKSNFACSNEKIKRIKIYDEKKCEIGVIKRAKFRAPWNKNIYRNVNMLLKDNSKYIITTRRNGLKLETVILPEEHQVKNNFLGIFCSVIDKKENVLISIKRHLKGMEIEYCDSNYKMLAICMALFLCIHRED